MAIPLLRGRYFSPRDDSAATPVAVVSAAIADLGIRPARADAYHP
jgi:hypothetical protein